MSSHAAASSGTSQPPPLISAPCTRIIGQRGCWYMGMQKCQSSRRHQPAATLGQRTLHTHHWTTRMLVNGHAKVPLKQKAPASRHS
jgi:hypothetical protein